MPDRDPADAPPPAATVIPYAPSPGRRRVWNWIRPGTAGFLLLVLATAVGGTSAAWTWRLREDTREFEKCAEAFRNGKDFSFIHPPTRAALRHLSRLAGKRGLYLDWPATEAKDGAAAFAAVELPNVTWIDVGSGVDANALLKTIAPPDTELKALSMLDLSGANVTDAGLKELARPEHGLRELTEVFLTDTQVTPAGIAELQKARPELTIYRESNTRPDSPAAPFLRPQTPIPPGRNGRG